MKKQELLDWIKSEQVMGNSIPVVVNGGGFSLLSPGDKLELSDEEYDDDIQILKRGDEFADFAANLSKVEYDDMTFVCVKHKTGYNQENMDIQLGTWDIEDELLHYDIVFNDSEKSDNKGFRSSKEYCIDYVKMYNGSNESYFEDYKGGIVEVVCIETEEIVYSEEVR